MCSQSPRYNGAILLVGEPMRIRLVITMLAVTVLSAWSFCQGTPASKSTYADLVAKVKAGDKSVDFKELRFAYADSPGGPDTDTQKKAMMSALNSKNYADALKNADRVLASDYVDMDAHFAEYIAYRELKDEEQAEFHKLVLQGLLDSIMHPGDGKSFETAFQVIQVHEEYVVLRFMGLMPSKQSMAEKNGHSYDVMGPPELRGQGGAALEFFLQLAGAKVLAQVFEFLNVEAEGALDVVAIGGQDVAPDLVRSHGEARQIGRAHV